MTIQHTETAHDSLFKEIEQNLQAIYDLWTKGNNNLRFVIPILCAAKLEAFINIVGKLKVSNWNILERKLSFTEKCTIAFSTADLKFDSQHDPSKTAVETFNARNEPAHPNMTFNQTDKIISHKKYETQSDDFSMSKPHPLRSKLTKEKVTQIKENTDAFIKEHAPKLLGKNYEYWMRSGATRGFSQSDPG